MRLLWTQPETATTMLCKIYPGEEAACAEARALRYAGAQADGMVVLTGSRLRDRREEPAGRFTGLAGPEAPVGTFAGIPRLRRDGAGTFAGDPARQRQGTFADTDSVVVRTFHNGGERSRVTGERAVLRLLRGTPLEGDIVDRVAGELRRGRAVVLAELPPEDIQARDLAQAA
jgi:hypothetical protein